MPRKEFANKKLCKEEFPVLVVVIVVQFGEESGGAYVYAGGR